MKTHPIATSAIPQLSLYEAIGGESAIKQLVQVFYDLVETDPEAHLLHLLHLRGNGIAHSRLEQFNFLSGFLGGPKLYVEKHGHSNVRKMHEHLEITLAGKDIWLKCMEMAIDQIGVDAGIKHKLMKNFITVANQLVNVNEAST